MSAGIFLGVRLKISAPSVSLDVSQHPDLCVLLK
jgi:hypothetical protein